MPQSLLFGQVLSELFSFEQQLDFVHSDFSVETKISGNPGETVRNKMWKVNMADNILIYIPKVQILSVFFIL
jgi:hypothetical protein